MEFIVTLYTEAGEVRTVYKSNQQQQAIELWQLYVADGKTASLSVER